jgi:hypothetical protein
MVTRRRRGCWARRHTDGLVLRGSLYRVTVDAACAGIKQLFLAVLPSVHVGFEHGKGDGAFTQQCVVKRTNVEFGAELCLSFFATVREGHSNSVDALPAGPVLVNHRALSIGVGHIKIAIRAPIGAPAVAQNQTTSGIVVADHQCRVAAL